jgi:hypothetical protein
MTGGIGPNTSSTIANTATPALVAVQTQGRPRRYVLSRFCVKIAGGYTRTPTCRLRLPRREIGHGGMKCTFAQRSAINKSSLAWHNGFCCLVALGGQFRPLSRLHAWIRACLTALVASEPRRCLGGCMGRPGPLSWCQTRQATGG